MMPNSVNNTPITFSVKASKNGKVTYDNVVSINVSLTGNYTRTINEIKELGTQVTVNAIYTGTNKLNTPAVQSIIIGNTENWYWNGDYLYYKNIVNKGNKIQMPTLSINDSNAVNANYNIIASIEAVKVLYDENGNEVANWNFNIINNVSN